MKIIYPLIILLMIFTVTGLGATTGKTAPGSHIFGELQARSIGPAAMSGRITALAVQAGSPNVFYVGAAAGGVWKTVNGGATFRPVFDDHIQSIGAITIDPSKPDIIWVGTGECWVRNSVSIGDGVYKSVDGGDNWNHMGLPDSERIARIIVHPKDSARVYVAAMGHLWDANPERGVYMTTDGGASWKRILYVNENTGCADLAMDPENPAVIYASMWEYRRSPYFFNSGGPGSGLYRSMDGGKTWRKIHKGFPTGPLGRIGIAVSPTHPATVYCVVEAEKTALLVSHNRGDSWRMVNDSKDIADRPFYYSVLQVDPQDQKTLYKLGFNLKISRDGGESFETKAGAHSDYHALWVNPENSLHMLLGTDGGVYSSRDGGDHWNFYRNLPVSQFYHISYDMQNPYHVYGGLQDNGSWGAPSRKVFGVTNSDWYSVGFSDGFYVWVDPNDPDTIYSEFFGGNILRVQRGTMSIKEIQPYPQKGDPPYRFNWNAPIAVTKNALYLGGQFLFRSTDQGESWQRISPDLTTNDPRKQKQNVTGGLTIDNSTAENYCTIYAIEISPHGDETIWAGTDDGNLWVTTTGGKTWRDVTANIPGLPPQTWCADIEVSPFAPETVFAVFDGHRSGDMTPYLFRSADNGKTWTSLATPDIKGFTRSLCLDPISENLLFLGTEFGLFVSIDSGQSWVQYLAGLPKVPVSDLTIHPRDHDLIIATHGRGVYIIDDLEIIRQITPEILTGSVHLFQPNPAVSENLKGTMRVMHGGEFVGSNPLEVGKIFYYLKRRPLFGSIKVEIYDGEGELVKSLPGSRQRGLNRVEWFLRLKPPKPPRIKSQALLDFPLQGPIAPEGTYTVKLIMGKKEWQTSIDVTYADDYMYPEADRRLKQKMIWKLYHLQNQLGYVDFAATAIKNQARDLLGNKTLNRKLKKFLLKMIGELEALRADITLDRDIQGLTVEQKLREKIVWLYSLLDMYGGRPSQTQIHRAASFTSQVAEINQRLEEIKNSLLKDINRELANLQLETIVVPGEEEFQKTQ